MDLNSVSMIMAPNLFLVQSGRHNKDLGGLQLSMAAGTSSIVRMLIKNQAIYWTVPPFMVQQIRHKNEMPQITKKPPKMRIKFLGRKDKSENSYRLPFMRGPHDAANVIHVEAPHLHKVNTAIQLDPDTTADDIVARFKPSVPEVNGSTANGDDEDTDSKDRIHLFEVGGNIGERQLDPRTKMLDLYSVNPHARWVVRAGQPH
ncbi:hypothetical protein NP493_466g05006 [Ridgeia piscesae]|uniref:RHG40/28/18 C-terminal ubiquitin-like domain-containing protein n=1 Tax=Ridgeia piscesae TaxID=27915 RepID=A0AAD9KYJ3_RIDPI|nr:hypothetical protein NP493_466g05006 [Ridgeia piscesae]